MVNRARAGVGLIPARAGKTPGSHCGRPRGAAHPRACGENSIAIFLAPFFLGSSPRVRGKLRPRRLHALRAGLIPARAGKTVCVCCCLGVMGAHPRACGENARRRGGAVPDRGSSPRVRGKPSPVGSSPSASRLIPARAGKTHWATVASRRRRAHPRACGENHIRTPCTWCVGGSSPRVRGKLCERPAVVGLDGLIPARAGKTRGGVPTRASARAHPRACGENFTRTPATPRAGGSSPRVRGKLPVVGSAGDPGGLIPARAGKTRPLRGAFTVSGTRQGRLIPARAGKTAAARCTRACGGAHPRACGENDVSEVMATDLEGSSPRVRGKLSGRLPAAASAVAHPRACGENAAPPPLDQAEVGSSPRVRGKRESVRAPVRSRGLIPARAGKTPSTRPGPGLRAAHPRACGENGPELPRRGGPEGSSPRVRGKRTASPAPSRTPEAHPRACGENEAQRTIAELSDGSSPRVRGKPLALPGLPVPSRAHPRACGENIR